MEQYFCKKQVKAINSFTSFIFFNRTCLSRWSPRPTGGRARDSGPEVDAVFRSPVSTKSAKTKDTCNVKFIKTNTAAIQQEKFTLNIFLIFWWSGFTNNEKKINQTNNLNDTLFFSKAIAIRSHLSSRFTVEKSSTQNDDLSFCLSRFPAILPRFWCHFQLRPFGSQIRPNA